MGLEVYQHLDIGSALTNLEQLHSQQTCLLGINEWQVMPFAQRRADENGFLAVIVDKFRKLFPLLHDGRPEVL